MARRSRQPARRRSTEPRDLGDVRRLVVKVGSGVLAGKGRVNRRAIARIARELSAIADDGREVVLVSSGAVASGFRQLGLKSMPRNIVAKQAAAAIGQQQLMHAYAEAFGEHRRSVGQVLLTTDDVHTRTRFLNARHTLEALMTAGAIPIVNENDSVSYDEIKLGDNDNLSAHVASLVDADLLVLLTTVQGVRANGGKGDILDPIDNVDDALEHVDTERSATGIGGMATKLEAAGLATHAGIPTVIADGQRAGVLDSILAGRPVGSLVKPRKRTAAARKRWIGYAARVKGALHVDEGAARAVLKRGASLLPSGIQLVAGDFANGATVDVIDPDGTPIARGIVSYNADEIREIVGRRSSEIARILGYAYSDEVIHRNDMIVVPRQSEDA